MNLRHIIRESINSVILDSIISEEIIKESGSARRNMGKFAPNNRRQTYQPKKNLQQKKQQNVIQNNQAAADKKQQNIVKKQQAAANREQRANAGRQERFNQWSNQWANKNLPQETPENTQQGGYGYTNSGFDNAENNVNTNNTQPNQQITPQPTQQPSADFNQYADELRKLVGNSGIDPKPVQNNQIAAQHVVKLNRFVFAVINAIYSNNIDSISSPAAGKGYNNNLNKYGEDKVDYARRGAESAVNYLGGQAENLLGNGTGIQNNPLNGVFSAGVKGYNDVNNLFTQQMNRQKYANMYGDSYSNNNSYDLCRLMTAVADGCYPRLRDEYIQLNQQNNGIFSATPDVGNCYNVLNNLYNAVQQYESQKKAQNKKQPTNAIQPANTPKTTNTTQTTPRGGVNNQNNEQYYNNLAGKLKLSEKECHNLAAKNKVNHKFDGNVENALDWVGDLCQKVVSANDNKDKQSLMKLLSLDGKTYDDIPTYDTVNEIYNREYELFEEEPGYKGILQNMKKAMTTLKHFRDQFMIDNGINNNR